MSFWTNSSWPSSGWQQFQFIKPQDGSPLFVENDILFSSVVLTTEGRFLALLHKCLKKQKPILEDTGIFRNLEYRIKSQDTDQQGKVWFGNPIYSDTQTPIYIKDEKVTRRLFLTGWHHPWRTFPLRRSARTCACSCACRCPGGNSTVKQSQLRFGFESN